MIYTDIEIAIRNLLLNNQDLKNLFLTLLNVTTIDLDKRIRIGHISNIDNPVFPCITFKIRDGGMDANQFSVSPLFYLSVWAKDQNDTCQQIYAIIRTAINLKQINGTTIAQCKEVGYEDSLFDKTTVTHYLTAWYEVKAINT